MLKCPHIWRDNHFISYKVFQSILNQINQSTYCLALMGKVVFSFFFSSLGYSRLYYFNLPNLHNSNLFSLISLLVLNFSANRIDWITNRVLLFFAVVGTWLGGSYIIMLLIETAYYLIGKSTRAKGIRLYWLQKHALFFFDKYTSRVINILSIEMFEWSCR